jgi:ribonuclease J
LKITIHRGTHQIGGCVTEIAAGDARIIIDMGAELPGQDTPSAPLIIDGLTCGEPLYDAVFFTHYHGDHVGMLDQIVPGIPMYMGEAAKDIYLTLQTQLHKNTEKVKAIIPFHAAQKIRIKDITVTPFIVDHSAFDAYMFLVEAGGRKILHTGDFRSHGYNGKGLVPVLEKHVGRVDLLITEGTTLSRGSEQVMSERALQTAATEIIRKHKYVFILCSSTNIDRIAAFCQATPRGKYFICDHYQKAVLDVAQEYGQRHTKLYTFDKVLTYGDNLLSKLTERGFCMLVRANDYFHKIMQQFDPSQSFVLYSLWKGYLQDESSRLKAFLNGYEWQYLHTSGHADRETLEEVIRTVAPRMGILPIHGERPDLFASMQLPCDVIAINDGETYVL